MENFFLHLLSSTKFNWYKHKDILSCTSWKTFSILCWYAHAEKRRQSSFLQENERLWKAGKVFLKKSVVIEQKIFSLCCRNDGLKVSLLNFPSLRVISQFRYISWEQTKFPILKELWEIIESYLGKMIGIYHTVLYKIFHYISNL